MTIDISNWLSLKYGILLVLLHLFNSVYYRANGLVAIATLHDWVDKAGNGLQIVNTYGSRIMSEAVITW